MSSRKRLPTVPAEGLSVPIDVGVDPRRARFFARLQLAGAGLFLMTVASIPISEAYGTWATHRAMLAEWVVDGPACPVVATPSNATRGSKPPPPFVYKGVGFAYQIGDAFCAAVPEKGLFNSQTFPVCQFDAPAAIAVTTARRTLLFEPGIGRSATVMVRGGRVSCVMGRGMRD